MGTVRSTDQGHVFVGHVTVVLSPRDVSINNAALPQMQMANTLLRLSAHVGEHCWPCRSDFNVFGVAVTLVQSISKRCQAHKALQVCLGLTSMQTLLPSLL